MLIKDDGVGFDLSAFDRGNGLRNMQERAKTLHGNIILQSEKNKGTVITLTIPLR